MTLNSELLKFQSMLQKELHVLTESPFQPVCLPQRLRKAMHYALTAPGKRLRPFLVFISGSLFDIETNQLLPVALSLECIHCYSLIHDDLP